MIWNDSNITYTSRLTYTLPQQVKSSAETRRLSKRQWNVYNDQQLSNMTRYLLSDQYGIEL